MRGMSRFATLEALDAIVQAGGDTEVGAFEGLTNAMPSILMKIADELEQRFGVTNQAASYLRHLAAGVVPPKWKGTDD